MKSEYKRINIQTEEHKGKRLTQLNTVAHNCELLKGLSDVCLSNCISSIHNTLLCQCAM